MHDNAFIVRGSYKYGLPENFKNNILNCASISRGCEHCDWINNGIVVVEGTSVNIIEHVTTNYEKKYGGGFTFNMIEDILDENGDELEIEDDSPFKIWLNTKL